MLVFRDRQIPSQVPTRFGVGTLKEIVLAITPGCLRLIPVLVAIAVCGCGGGNKTGHVSGTVTFNGAPLAEGSIVFHPLKGRPARGEIQNGEIVEVTTLEPGDGAPLGDVKIAIQASKPDPNDPSGMKRISLIPDKYGNSDTSGLTATITSGRNVLKFDLMP
jgi:hypothetical protein